jgi:hypothetical protein
MAATKAKSKKTAARTASKSKAAPARPKAAARSKAKSRKTAAIIDLSGIEKNSPQVQLLTIIFSLLALIFMVLAYYKYS